MRPKYWLDFGTNQYKPYALQGGATDLHLPFVAQVTLVLLACRFYGTVRLLHSAIWFIHAILFCDSKGLAA